MVNSARKRRDILIVKKHRPRLLIIEVYLVGQEGSGKTTRAIRAFPGRKNPGLVAMTYYKYFYLEATPIDEWDPACLRKKTLTEILIFDENIMCGDPGQLTSWDDKEGPHKFLTDFQHNPVYDIHKREYIDDLVQVLILHDLFKNTEDAMSMTMALSKMVISANVNINSIRKYPNNNISDEFYDLVEIFYYSIIRERQER
ncbi:5108_t:CDS:2 [Funneliformis geosporum]|nr:5108_t:CDS:2 [Funneliformis geosporum]